MSLDFRMWEWSSKFEVTVSGGKEAIYLGMAIAKFKDGSGNFTGVRLCPYNYED